MTHNNWIEIAGLPGVGKTTLIEKHLSFIQSQRKIIQSRNSALLQRIFVKACLYGWMGWVFKNKLIALSMAYRFSFRAFERKNAPVLFYDSGLVQPILEMFILYEGEDIDAMIEVFKKCTPSSTLIYLSDDLSKVLKRELARGARRYPDLDEKELLRRYKNAEEILKRRVFPLIPTVHVVDIHNETGFLEKLKS